MLAKTVTGKAGEVSRRLRGLTLLGAATAAAGVVGLTAPAPTANAIDVTIDPTITTGPLMGLVAGLGITTIPIPVGALGIDNLVLQLANTTAEPVNLNDTVNAVPMKTRLQQLPLCALGGTGLAGNCRVVPVIASGTGAVAMVDAYRAMIASAQGNTPEGYTQLIAGQTNLGLVLVNDLLRPNGGFYTRFPFLAGLFGVDTTIPPIGQPTGERSGVILNPALIDATWAYDPSSDFPVTLNPFSLTNTLLAALPLNLLGGTELVASFGTDPATATGNDAINAIVAGFGTTIIGGLAPSPGTAGSTSWVTVVPDNLPILEPLRLPVQILNYIATQAGEVPLLKTPFADALQPAFKILVNIGYPDVVTPADIANDPATYGDYAPYDRTFGLSATTTPFLSERPLSFEELLRVPGDLVGALITGFQDAFPPPALEQEPAAVTPPAAATPQVTATAARTETATDPVPAKPGNRRPGRPAPDQSAPQDQAAQPRAAAVSAARADDSSGPQHTAGQSAARKAGSARGSR
ncbi:MAG: PE-PPE domain-containing protein [Mycobacterium sp.]|nr:PE-PPE domain-containing protein [Mycobacterium sp.]